MKIQMNSVSSHIIEAEGYDKGSNTLRIRFKNGTYEYKNVSEETYRAFLQAESKGSFFLSFIKGKPIYPWRKVSAEELAKEA